MVLLVRSWYDWTSFFQFTVREPVFKIIDIRQYLFQAGFLLFFQTLDGIEVIRFDNIQLIFVTFLGIRIGVHQDIKREGGCFEVSSIGFPEVKVEFGVFEILFFQFCSAFINDFSGFLYFIRIGGAGQ